jgi:ADP-heptose:LPS heptosyltransferase
MRFSALGDIAMARPLIECLKQKPLIITSELGKAVLSDIADDFLILPSKKLSDVLRLTQAVRHSDIDVLIDLQNSDRTRAMRLLANKRLSKNNLVTPDAVDRATTTHNATQLFMMAAERFFNNRTNSHQKEYTGALAGYDFSPKQQNKDYIVIHPGSSAKWTSKRLPLEKWQQFGRILQARFALPIMITGDASEYHYAEAVRKVLPGHAENLAGSLSIAALRSLLNEAFLTVSTDSGPMHLSAVQKTPTIGLFGATSWRYFAPFGPWSSALYDPLYYKNRPTPGKNLQECPGAYKHIDLEQGLDQLRDFLR